MTKEYLEHLIRQQMIFIETSGKHITGMNNIVTLIDEYASQEKEKEAVGFVEWKEKNKIDYRNRIFIKENVIIAYDSKQLYELYKEKTK